MTEIIVKSQQEFDAVPVDYNGRIIIAFGTRFNRAVVNRTFDNAVVEARGNSSVEAWENSSVVAWGNSSVVARENSSVVAWENSSVVAWGNSSVVAWGNSSVEACGNSSVVARGNSSVVGSGNSQIHDCSNAHNVTTSANSRIVYSPRNIKEYCEHYQIDCSGDIVKLYKAVHKRDERFVSDKDQDFEYIIGNTAVADSLTTDTSEICGHGIHMAYKEWCVDYGKDWPDLAIIEVEAEANAIIVPVPGCGKVRAKSVKVVREVPLEECGLMGKIIAKKLARQ